MMTGKEKLYFLLDAIDDVRAIAPSDQPLIIDPMNDLKNKIRKVELSQLFTKLEKDEQVLKVLKVPSRIKTFLDEFDPYDHADDGCWHIELLPAFDKYYLKIQQEPEYQEFTGKKPATPQKQDKTTKYNRKALEKIWNVLQEMEEKRQLGAENAPISINRYPYGDEIKNYDKFYEIRKSVLQKLLSLGAITNLKEGAEGALDFWSFRLGDNYQKVFEEYQSQYKEAAKDYQQSKQTEEIKVKDPVYEVKYSEKTREILINNFLVKKPHSFGENDAIFAYLYKNPNKDLSIKEIEKATRLKSLKNLHKFVENIGFSGDLRRAFFKVSKDKIRFNNPITKKDLEEIGIKYLKLS